MTYTAVAPLTTRQDRASQPRKLSSRYVPALDGLRGVAILLVLGHHFRFILEPSFRLERISLWLLDGGWCGVELFFVLSGFLITGILLDSKHSPGFFRNFYTRRALRIFPLYYAYLAFVFLGLAAWWTAHFHHNPWASINPIWYILYLQNFKSPHMFYDQFLGHLWSLAIEEQFYLIWAFLVLCLNRSSLGFACVAGIASALIARLFLAGQGVQESFFLNTLTVASIDSLCAGALIAILMRSEPIRKRSGRWIAALAVVSAVGFALLAKTAGSLFLYNVPIHTWGLTFLSFLFACLIYWIASQSSGVLDNLLSLPALRLVGRVSYGMYVLHPAVIGFVLPRVDPVTPGTAPWLQFLIKIGVFVLLTTATFLAALFSWLCWEKPFLRLKDKFQYRRQLVITTQPGSSFASTGD